MSLRSRILACLLSVLTTQVSSQAQSQESGDLNAGADGESQFLFINMLEFLAEFETDEGEWISPEILSDDAFVDLERGDNSIAVTSGQGVLSETEEND